jgi:hypothetical protein
METLNDVEPSIEQMLVELEEKIDLCGSGSNVSGLPCAGGIVRVIVGVVFA